MPSGGGSAGGGGGGGGGGFSSSSSGGGGGGDGGPGSCLAAVGSLVAIAVVALVIGLSVGLTRRQQQEEINIATEFYSPGDSRLLSLSSFFCEGGVLELTSNSVDAELFLVDSTPPLRDMNSFTVTLESMVDSLEFRFWQYHLYPGSEISLLICTDLLVDVYVVKGNENANSWASEPSSDVAEMFQLAPACCPNEVRFARPITYQVEEEDEYYVILHNSLSEELFANVSLSFERTEYSPPAVDPANTCTVSERGNCRLNIPYGTGSQRFLVTTSIPQDVDWEENISVSLNCGQRGWAYALVILLPLAVLVGSITAIVLACVCYSKCKRSSSEDESPELSDFPNPDTPAKNAELSDFNQEPPPYSADLSDFNPDPPPSGTQTSV